VTAPANFSKNVLASFLALESISREPSCRELAADLRIVVDINRQQVLGVACCCCFGGEGFASASLRLSRPHARSFWRPLEIKGLWQ
jgi:hypothetical protein